MIKHIPNIFTSLRILCSPIILVLQVMAALNQTETINFMTWSFWIYVVAACTDWVDGFLARALNAKSELGAKLDLLADKALVGLTLLGAILGNFIVTPKDLWWLVIAIGASLMLATSGRDYLVTNLRNKGASFGLNMPATFLAKSKTAVIMVGLGLYLGAFATGYAELLMAGLIVVILGALMSIFTGIQYLLAYNKAKKAFSNQ